jgi:hypothetical protein
MIKNKLYIFLEKIFSNNNTDIKKEFINQNAMFGIFNFFSYFEHHTIILENENFCILIKKDNLGSFEFYFIDPISFENELVEVLEQINYKFSSIESFIDFIQNKNNPCFHYKQHLLNTMKEHGVIDNFDLIDLNDKLTLSIEDILSLMKDSYLKSLKNKT